MTTDKRFIAKNDWPRILVGLAVSIIALIVIFYFVDLNQLIQDLRQADYRFVIGSILMTLLWLMARGVLWRILLQEKASFRQVFLTVNEGYLMNNILPLRLGEVGRTFLIGQKANIGFWQASPSVVIERALDLGFAAGLLLITLPFVIGASWALQAATAAGVLVLVGFVVLYLVALYRKKVLVWFERLSRRWSLLGKLGGRALPGLLDGLAMLTDLRRFAWALLWSALNWVIAIGQYWILMLAFMPDAQPLWAAFSLGVAALGAAAPSSPGAIGVLEASLIGALAVFGVNSATALAFAFVLHFIQYMLTGIIGVYALYKDGLNLAGLYQQARSVTKS